VPVAVGLGAMRDLHKLMPRKMAFARLLLIAFAFSAWSMTGLAHVTLFLLLALFLCEIPGAWGQLHRDPAYLLSLAAVAGITILALRAAILFPQIATDQWHAIWVWSAPFLFVVIAWWLHMDLRQIPRVMLAAMVGIVFGVLRKSDWSLADKILGGLRYHFGYAALGLAFIASVVLVGLYLFRPRITGFQIKGTPRPILGWALWIASVLFFLGIVVVTQSRGSILSLAIVMTGYAVYSVVDSLRRRRFSTRKAYFAVFSSILFIVTATSVFWVRWPTEREEWEFLSRPTKLNELSYNSSLTIRINLYRIGFQLFSARPIMGWGPGTSSTEYLVPERVLPFSENDLQNVPDFSHLHSVLMEILVRFGLLGVSLACVLIAVLFRAYRSLWCETGPEPDLRYFLLLGGVMMLLYCVYDFRLVHVDFRFFSILFLGILYSFQIPQVDRQGRSVRKTS
jgi:O-antigen ligase